MRREILVGDHGTRLSVLVPQGRRERMRGLLGVPPLREGTGLLLEGARSVHTFGLRTAIAAVLLDGDLRVRGAAELRPHRVLLPRPGVRHVLELAPGARIVLGERLRRVEDPAGRVRPTGTPRYTGAAPGGGHGCAPIV